MRLPSIAPPPIPTRVKLPGVDARLVTDKAVTICGLGTAGLGDHCRTAAQDRVSAAYEEWVEYKKSVPRMPTRSTRSPRERYSMAKEQHEAALMAFEAKQQKLFEVLHAEKKKIAESIVKQQKEQLNSMSSAIQEGREARQQRMDEYLRMKNEMAQNEKLLSAQIAEIWKATGKKADDAWLVWIALRREKQDAERAHFLLVQREHSDHVANSAAQMRKAREQRARMIEESRQEELRQRKAEAASIRKAIAEGGSRARYAHQESVQATCESLRKTSEQWAARRQENAKKQSILPKSSIGTLQRSLNAKEESVLAKQHAADALRNWKSHGSLIGESANTCDEISPYRSRSSMN